MSIQHLLADLRPSCKPVILHPTDYWWHGNSRNILNQYLSQLQKDATFLAMNSNPLRAFIEENNLDFSSLLEEGIEKIKSRQR